MRVVGRHLATPVVHALLDKEYNIDYSRLECIFCTMNGCESLRGNRVARACFYVVNINAQFVDYVGCCPGVGRFRRSNIQQSCTRRFRFVCGADDKDQIRVSISDIFV